MELEWHCGSQRRGRIKRTDAVWQLSPACREDRSDRPHRHNDIFKGPHLDRVFPAQLIGIGGFDLPVPADPVDDLDIEHMPVDGVRVNTVVRNLPDLGTVTERANLCSVHRVVEDLGGWIDIEVRDRCLGLERCPRDFNTEHRIHAAILKIEVLDYRFGRQVHGNGRIQN